MAMQVERFLRFGNCVCGIAIAAYFYGMLVHPFLHGGWKNTHEVWLEWQSLNVGVLAFAASVIAFNISKYHDDQQRKRELVAARSFLPHALSDLTAYLKTCSTLLAHGYQFAENYQWPNEERPDIQSPMLPSGYAQVFEKCISLSDSPLADRLSHILMKLQINQSRLSELAANLVAPGNTLIIRANVIAYIFRVAELQCLINALFPCSRGEEELKNTPLDWEAFRNAYGTLDFWLHEYDDLEDFTKRVLDRNKGEWKIA